MTTIAMPGDGRDTLELPQEWQSAVGDEIDRLFEEWVANPR